MIYVFATRLDHFIENDIFNKFKELISEDRKKTAFRYAKLEDTHRTLAGELLARYAIFEKYGIHDKDVIFTRNEYGKPCVLDKQHIHFNISHSGDWIVCALGDFQVGIDIELIRKIDFSVAISFLSQNEMSKFEKLSKESRLKYFYEIWTLKESYVKAKGTGLSISPNIISMQTSKDDLEFPIFNDECWFKQYFIDNDYILSVCAFEKEFNEKVTFVGYTDFLELN